MKDFVKMVLAVICGILILSIVSFFLTFAMIGAMAAAGSGKPVLPKSGVLSLDLSKVVIAEQSQDGGSLGSVNPASLLAGGEAPADIIGIWDAVQAVNAAAEDPAVKYIFLRTDGNASGVTALGELRVALERFRTASGKPVVSYMESPGSASLYLASVSDKIYMNSSLGLTPQFTGVGSQMYFLGDLLKRVGVNVQLIRHGKYKSAGEMYTRSSASPENREQYQRMIDSMWEVLGATIAESRGITVDNLDAAIEGLKLRLPQDFVDCRLVDELLDRKGLEDKLATLAVVDKYKDIKWIAFKDYVDAKVLPGKAKQKIAVIYADGEIIDGKGKTDIAGDRFASVIAKVAADSTVKAVVLRVNSPGGSVTASEKIKNELDRLQEVKPLVASYGDYAASGGYWISNRCDKIFSDATTLTGSIGVFGLVPDFSGTAKDIAHVGVESVTSHKHGDMFGLMRPLDAEEFHHPRLRGSRHPQGHGGRHRPGPGLDRRRRAQDQPRGRDRHPGGRHPLCRHGGRRSGPRQVEREGLSQAAEPHGAVPRDGRERPQGRRCAGVRAQEDHQAAGLRPPGHRHPDPIAFRLPARPKIWKVTTFAVPNIAG